MSLTVPASTELVLPRRLNSDRMRIRSEVAKHVARVFLVEPEQFADWTVYAALRQIPYVSHERAMGWLAACRIEGLRRGESLSLDERLRLVNTLTAFAKEQPS